MRGPGNCRTARKCIAHECDMSQPMALESSCRLSRGLHRGREIPSSKRGMKYKTVWLLRVFRGIEGFRLWHASCLIQRKN